LSAWGQPQRRPHHYQRAIRVPGRGGLPGSARRGAPVLPSEGPRGQGREEPDPPRHLLLRSDARRFLAGCVHPGPPAVRARPWRSIPQRYRRAPNWAWASSSSRTAWKPQPGLVRPQTRSHHELLS